MRRLFVGVLVVAGLALGATGCGAGGALPGVATADGATGASGSPTAGAADPKDEKEAALAYARCMRENGVPDFPDPQVGDHGEMRMTMPEGSSMSAVDKATETCKHLLPNGGAPGKADPELVEKLRGYAKCMRENGVPNFPDPTDGGLQIDGGKLGVDPQGATFKAAEEKCKNLLPDPPPGDQEHTATTGGSA
jgi:hypothetical protein